MFVCRAVIVIIATDTLAADGTWRDWIDWARANGRCLPSSELPTLTPAEVTASVNIKYKCASHVPCRACAWQYSLSLT